MLLLDFFSWLVNNLRFLVESSYVSLNVTDFFRFSYLNIPCLGLNITLIFINSQSSD